jgi:hypothetical protein
MRPVFVLAFLLSGASVDAADLEKQRCPRPAEFALVFSRGYAGDDMPKEDDRFEELLRKIKDGGFNTIHCTYTPKRLELCKKHGIKMMVDLLSVQDHHVYQSPEKAKAVCEKLRNNPDVWGYNVWNDIFGKSVEGRKRDINSVREWDPTHPAFSGTYRTGGMNRLTNPDVFGYYNFHWKRGVNQQFPHLLQYSQWASERNAVFYRWLETDAGQAGKGNFNRSLYSVNTSIACGLKGVLWFLGTSLMNPKTLEYTTNGTDITKVNKEILPLAKEIAKIGNPIAIHSTPMTRTVNNQELPDGKKELMPPGLEGHAFPADFWARPVSGEFLAGVFKYGADQDALFLANHNAYAGQEVRLKLAGERKAELFNRREGKWQALKVKDGILDVSLPPAGGELLRFSR